MRAPVQIKTNALESDLMRSRLTAWLALLALCSGAVGLPTSADAGPRTQKEGDTPERVRDEVVTSFDGTPLIVHFFPAAGRAPGRRAPTVMVAHGFGEAGPADPDGPRLAGAPTVSTLLEAGYNVVTWDARGHGGSGGSAMLDSPDHELRDTQAVLDFVAEQPEVRLDAPGDPRVGMAGASYGGIIQYLMAAFDRRVDVIEPAYTAYSLSDTTLTQAGKLKEGWALALSGIAATNVVPGITSPLGPQVHSVTPDLVTGMATSLASGTLDPGLRRFLDYRSPSTYLHRVHVPTLVTGGTSDTLFPLPNAIGDYRALKRRGVPVKMVWNCEGHSVCPGDTGPLVERFDRAAVAWFDRWLKRDRSVSTGPEFSWIADNESRYRSAPAYPPAIVDGLHGEGTGSLLLTAGGPLSSLGLVLVGGKPASVAVDVPVVAPSRGVDILGSPRLRLTYRGSAVPDRT